MAIGTGTLAKIPATGQITMPAVGGIAADLAILIAAALNIEPREVYFVDDLTPQAGDFTYSYNEPAGTRYPGALFNIKKAKTTKSGHKCFVKSDATAILVDFTAYVDRLPVPA